MNLLTSSWPSGDNERDPPNALKEEEDCESIVCSRPTSLSTLLHHIKVRSRIVSLDERVDRLLHESLLQLSFSKSSPHFRLVAPDTTHQAHFSKVISLLGELIGSVEVSDVVDENVDSRAVDLQQRHSLQNFERITHIKLLEDGKSLLIEFVRDGDVGDIGSIVVIELLKR